MAWQLLAAALPAAAKVAGTYLQKPSREDYKPQTDYMKKYLGYLRGRSAGKEVMHMAMQPQLRAIGRQGREMQRQVGYDVAKTGLAGSGIEAQMRLSAGAQTQEALSVATGKAAAAQAAEDARIGEKSADLAARIGAEEQRSEQAYEMAGRQWQRQMGSEVLGLGASIAGAKISQAGQLKQAKGYALRSGLFENEEQINELIEKYNYDASMLTKEVDISQKRTTALLGAGYDPEDIKGGYGMLGLGGRGVSSGTGDPDKYIKEIEAGAGVEAPTMGGTVDVATDVLETGTAGLTPDIETYDVPEVTPVVEEAVKGEVTPVVEEAVKPIGEAIESPGYKEGQYWLPHEGKYVDVGSPEHKADLKRIGGRKIPPKSFAKMMEGIRPVARENADGSVSTVVLAQSDNLVYPTIFPKDPDNPTSDPDDWIELEGDAALAEAKKRGEIFELGSEKEAIKIAEGSWKPEGAQPTQAVDDVKKAEFGEWEDPTTKDKPSLGKRLLGKYYKRDAQDIGAKVRESYKKGKYYKRDAQDIATKVREAYGKGKPEIKLPEGFKKDDYSTYPKKVIEGVTYHVDPATDEPIMSVAPETPKRKTIYEKYVDRRLGSGKEPLSEDKWKAIGKEYREKREGEVKPITTVEKDVKYEIWSQGRDKTKRFKWTGKKLYGRYTFKSDDGKELKLTLEQLNDRLKKKGKSAVTDSLLDAMESVESGGATEKDLKLNEKREGAIGLYQQRDIFYKDVTERMGFPPYDRNDDVKARAATKHYLEYVMKNYGLTKEQAVAAYNAGVEGQKKGIGVDYATEVFKTMGTT